MSYSLQGLGALGAASAPPSVAALCATRGGVASYTESGFTFTVSCADGRSCAGGAEQDTKCQGGMIQVHGGGGPVAAACPFTTSADGPDGVPVYGTLSGPVPTVCGDVPSKWAGHARACNDSRDPLYCYFATALSRPYANRGSADAVKAWNLWLSRKLIAGLNQPPAPSPGSPPPPQTPPPNWRYGISLPGSGAAVSPIQSGGSPASAPAAPDHTMMYVGIGGVALLLVAGVLYLRHGSKQGKAAHA